MNVLVTGATGFIGGHIAQRLKHDGNHVRALVRDPAKASLLEQLGAEVVVGDLTNPQSLVGALRNIDTVFHAAARVSDWGKWADFEAATVQSAENLLEASREAGIRRFVHISSVAVYDDRYTRAHRIVTEDAPHGRNGDRSYGYYSRAKVQAEQSVWRYREKGVFECTILRPAFVYGPRDRTTLPRLLKYLQGATATWVGFGNPVIDPIFVSDVVECAVLAAENNHANGQAYNVAPDYEVRVREFWKLLCATAGINAPRLTLPRSLVIGVAVVSEALWRLLRSRNPPSVTRAGVATFCEDRHFDSSKANRELGWQARVGPEEGLRLTCQWMLAQG